MLRRQNTRWLDVGVDKVGAYTLRDHGCLSRLVSQMDSPNLAFPALLLFLGSERRDRALRSLLPDNGARNAQLDAAVKLRYNSPISQPSQQWLIADSNPTAATIIRTGKLPPPGCVSRILGVYPSPRQILVSLYTQLLFPFVDVVCLFADDFPTMSHMVDFLEECATTSTCMPKVRPRLLIVLDAIGNGARTDPAQASSRPFDPTQWSSLFSAISVVSLPPSSSPKAAGNLQPNPLTDLLVAHLKDMNQLRVKHNLRFTTSQTDVFFQLAVAHFVRGKNEPFDFVRSTCARAPTSVEMMTFMSHYQGLCIDQGLRADEIAQSIASALVMNYVYPGMPLLDPREVFQAFYRAQIPELYRDRSPIDKENWRDQVEEEIVDQFRLLRVTGKSAVELRKCWLTSHKTRFREVKSNQLCLHCLTRSPQHPSACGHSFCHDCPQLFGTPAADAEFRFSIHACFLCNSETPLIIDILPPTMNPSILAIDGGGVRGVIPLEFLILVQDLLGKECRLQDVIDLVVGTSAGGLEGLALVVLDLDPASCAQLFDRLARHIFCERRKPLPCIPRFMFGQIRQWLAWWLYDGCYDGRVFDLVLQETFGKRRGLFSPTKENSSGPLISKTKIGVVATSIDKDTDSFVFGNFNNAGSADDCGYGMVRAKNIEDDPRVWEAARATAAAPFLFPPAHIPAVGSFQDGGLRDNFAGGIARRISRQIWRSSREPACLLSLGTGTAPRSKKKDAPHFRHVFLDGFIFRAFNAWMSSLDTEKRWEEMRSQLDPSMADHFRRFNVELTDAHTSLDNVQAMEGYRNIVLGNSHSVQIAKDAAIDFLISRIFFTLDARPRSRPGTIWCHGTIRCKGPTRAVLSALVRLLPSTLEFVTDRESLGQLFGEVEICPACARYCRPVSLQIRNLDDVINIYLKAGDRRWRINGFPTKISDLEQRQGLRLQFGEYVYPGAQTCQVCGKRKLILRGGRRKRSTDDGRYAKRACTPKM